jgi:transposase
MPSAQQITGLLDQGHTYEEVAESLGISPGLAYLIATGIPADGGDTLDATTRRRPHVESARTQRLSNPPHHNPTHHPDVEDWVRRRAAAELRATGEADR